MVHTVDDATCMFLLMKITGTHWTIQVVITLFQNVEPLNDNGDYTCQALNGGTKRDGVSYRLQLWCEYEGEMR